MTTARPLPAPTTPHRDLAHDFEQLSNRQPGTCGLCGSTRRDGVCR